MKKAFLALVACSLCLFTCKKDNSSNASFSATVAGTSYQVDDSKITASFQKVIPPTGFTIRYKSISVAATMPNGYIVNLSFSVPLDADSNCICIGAKNYYALSSDSSDAQDYHYADGSDFAPYVQGGLASFANGDIYTSVDSVFATVTSCNEATQTISGTFWFKADGFGNYGDTVSVTNGSFTNVHYIKH